jgi:hypothetical protein
VSIRSGALGGEFLGEITEIGITYVTLTASEGPEHLPNSQVLAAAVRPEPPTNDESRPADVGMKGWRRMTSVTYA